LLVCQIASCLFSKTVHCTTFPLWSESQNLPFVRHSCQDKNRFGVVQFEFN
jgi:hypothetical protein